jgi:zinc-ribbon domain
VFCPNCGAQNPDNATTCQKCGFAMRGAAGPKFKGTMLMMNTPGGLVPGAATPGSPPPGAGQPGAVPPPGQAPLPQAPPPADAAPAARQRLKGTMIGVAPPAMGGATPYAPPAQPAPAQPVPAANQAPAYQAPAQDTPRGYGALSPTTAMPAVGAPATSAMSSFEPQAPRPTAGSINPLGGTLVAPPGGQQAWANPRGAAGSPSANPEIPVDMRDSALMGGAPGGNPAFGATPYAQPAAYGSTPGAGYGFEGVPATQPGNSSPGTAPGALTRFTERPPWRVALFMVLTFGIYGVLWFAWTADELRAQGRELPPSWHLIIPILNIIWVWKWCVALEGVSNGEQSSTNSFLLLFFLGPIGAALVQSKLNDL